ncbi:uncharacterized protein B0H18DRAFT_1008147 [Fomitopsis serialis]|uniref:uncharacterized protein n=1 Tax=Fomitopsis serialis TaxID=139415 RepID=UPI0020084010|nr:uncharacterized protein B0H18DRAFT_1008147 [Neoantrodia serialis]KAH9925764.1 hypothetical protein B0H18DRAFT_1008147 [Neoantrodia serialis]
MLGPAFALAVPLLGSLASAASTGVAAESLNALTRHCQFTLGNRRFDLCPVFEGNDGGWTVGLSAEYRISFAGPLKTTKWTPHDEQCPDGTWVCKIISNSPRVLQVIPVAGDISGSLPKKDDGGDGFAGEEYQPGLNVTAKLVPADENTRHGKLLSYLRASHRPIAHNVAWQPTKPSIYWNWNGTHTFEWRTKHACGQAMTAPDDDSPPPTPPKHNPGSDEPPKDSEDDDVPGDKKILDPDFLYGQTRRSIMTIFASSALVVIVVTYLVQRPPARLRRFALSYMKTHPWLMHSRVGERMLMRWAREDLIFDAGEEDVMINGPTNVRSAVGLDEGIPLKPSPRRPNNYGSA